MITLIYGPNHYRRQAEVNSRTDNFVKKNGNHGLERWDGEEIKSPQELTEILQSISLFSSEKLVVIRGLSKNKPLWDYLGEHLSDISWRCDVILVEESPDRRTKTFKALQKLSAVITCDEPSENQLIDWIIKTGDASGKPFTKALAMHLLRRVGSDQTTLSQEIAKVSLVTSDLTAELIDNHVESSPEGSAFDLLDAVVAKKTELIADLLKNLRYQDDPYRLFGLLVSQVFTLALVHAAGSMPADEIAKQAAVHPFVVRKLKEATGVMSQTELAQVVSEVALLDDRLKSSVADPWLLIEQALSKIAAR